MVIIYCFAVCRLVGYFIVCLLWVVVCLVCCWLTLVWFVVGELIGLMCFLGGFVMMLRFTVVNSVEHIDSLLLFDC